MVTPNNYAENGQANDTAPQARNFPRKKLINSEKDIVKILNEIRRWYKENLPTSPVPAIISDALDLIGKDFLEATAILMEKESLQIRTSFDAKICFGEKESKPLKTINESFDIPDVRPELEQKDEEPIPKTVLKKMTEI